MAIKASLLLAFFLVFFAGTLARQQQHPFQQQQQNQCQIRQINALEPYDTVEAEAGVTEFWESENQQFQCAGVEFIRHRIRPRGLLLPSYVNTPLLSFTEEGKGVIGVVRPGCPETYESSSEQQQQQFSDPRQQRGPQRLQDQDQDRHQKVENLRQGDVVAIPAGAAHWIYNDGDNDLVVVVFFDTQNTANQLDQNHRRFFLAGNPQGQSQQQGGQGERQQQGGQGERQQRESQQHHGKRQPGRQEQEGGQRQPGRHQEQQYRNVGNIFNGFDVEFLVQAFNIDRQLAEQLQGQRDNRGHIVSVQQELQIIRPPHIRQQQQQEQQQERGSRGGNGIEETVCSQKLKENIDNPSHVDFTNPQAGRISNLNNLKFPILRHLQLSVARGELYPNAIQSPQWFLNAHNLVYVTNGRLRIQIVNNEGQSVFNDELRQGQVVVIPQNFAVIKRASEEGARWISFRTNDNAITGNLAGRVSAIRSLPVDVVANAYQVSREDAQRLKFNQKQTALFSPRSSGGQSWGEVILNLIE